MTLVQVYELRLSALLAQLMQQQEENGVLHPATLADYTHTPTAA